MRGTLWGVGVGPGDPGLVTREAARLIAACPVVAYARADGAPSFARAIVADLMGHQIEEPIVVPMRAARHPAGAVYDEAAARLAAHLDAGRDVAVPCEGDPFHYGSFMYLHARLRGRYAVRVVPGITSICAAAAAIGRPLAARDDVLVTIPATLPNTAIEAQLAACEGAAIIKLGRHLPRLRALIERMGLTDRTAYCERVGLPAQRLGALREVEGAAPYFSMLLVYRGPEAAIAGATLPSLGAGAAASTARAPDLRSTGTAGKNLTPIAPPPSPSGWPGASGREGAREEARKDRPAIVVLNPASLGAATRAARALDGDLHLYAPRFSAADGETFDDAPAHLRAVFAAGRAIVAFAAAGIVIRALAPVLGDKRDEPPVIAVSPDGASIVPLLGGHRGANALAGRLAGVLDGHAALTTAGEAALGLALDAPPAGWTLAAGDAKAAMAAVLSGAGLAMDAALDWPAARALAERMGTSAGGDGGTVRLLATDAAAPASEPLTLAYRPRRHVLGLGCERGADPAELLALARETLAAADLDPASLAAVASLDLKADEAAIHAVADALGVPAQFLDAATLERETPRLANPSDVVFAEVGCHGVAEGAALAGAGEAGALIVPKLKSARATAAIARAPGPVAPEFGRARGSLAIVGIGPGAPAWRSPEATAALRRASDWVGYSLYLDLAAVVGERTRHDYPLGAEEARVRDALELAGTGRDVALVCSGDAGIYAMATLAFELIDRGDVSDAARRVALTVCPGISALQAAAARAGAPLGHDFCTISLSDLLTPWPDIVRRVEAAARGDFVIAFYNPVSRRRRTQLAHARDVLLKHRPADTPVVLATNLGREGESVRVMPLAELNVDEVDMLTVVLVGSSQTRTVRTGDGRTWAYTPRGYGAKAGTRIAPGTGEAA